MLIPLIGFAPDLDPTTPGVLVDCSNKIPTLKGIKGASSRVSVGISALPATCIGAAITQKLDGTYRLFAGTTTNLYEASGLTSWTDRTKLSGTYSAGTSSRWRFAQYGDVTLAITKQDPLQQIDASSNFATVTAAPRASIVETVDQFVFLFDTTEGTYGTAPNRWWCSAIGDYTDWTPAVATQCVTGTLTSSAGAIRAAKRLGKSVVVYKERSMFLGTYQGPPTAWSFDEVSNIAGAQSQEAVVPIVMPNGGYAHIFMGADNFYLYDGSKPVEIGSAVKSWFFARLNLNFAFNVQAMVDDVNSIVYFFYPSNDSTLGVLDSCLVYNYRVNKWGRYDQSIETAVSIVSGGLTYATLATRYALYSSIPSISYGAPFWYAGARQPSVFDTSHQMMAFAGDTTTSSMTTGDIGDDNTEVFISAVKPRYLTAPTSSLMTNYYKQNIGDSLTVDGVSTLTSGKFDMMRSARWHRLKIDDTGPSEVPAIDVALSKDGDQ